MVFINKNIKILLVIFSLLLSFYCTAETKSDDLIQQALAAAQEGDPQTAIPLLEQAEKKHPFHSANSEILFQLSSAYIDIGQFDKADANLKILLKRYGKYADRIARVDSAIVAQARVMVAQGKYDEAIQHIKKFLKEKPKSGDKDSAYYQLASAYIEKGDYDNAEKLLKPVAANEKSAMHDGAIYLMANIAAKKKDYIQTEKLMALLVKTAKNRDAKNNALFKLGDIYRRNGNLVKAIDQYRRIKSKGNDAESRKLNAGILFEIAQTYEKLNHPLEAHIGFEGVAKLYYDTELSTEAWHRAILSDGDYGNYARAEKSYYDFLKAHSDKAPVNDVRLYFAQKFIENNDYSNAIYNLKKGLQEFPSGKYSEISFNLLGITYLNAKQFNDAEQTLKEFAKKFPDSELVPASYFYLAEAYAERELYSQSLNMLQNLIDDFPSSGEAKDAARRAQEVHMVYADYLINTNRFIAAIEQYRKIIEEDLVENAAYLIGDCYMQAGQYDNAATAFMDFVGRFPESELAPQANFSIGEAQMQAERYSEAEQTFDSIISKDLSLTNPILPYAQLQIAFCKYYLNDTAGMSNALAKVIEKYPSSNEAGDAYYWIGYLLRSATAYKEAAETYDNLIEKFPNHNYAAEAAYLAGESYALGNNSAKALEKLQIAFNKFPYSGYGVLALVRAGDIYNQKYNQLDTFLAETDKIISKKPNVKKYADIAKAGALIHAGMAKEAETVMPELTIENIRYNDVLGYALALQAGILNEKKEYKKAVETAEQAEIICSQTNIGLDEALFQHARALFLQKEYESAEQLYAKLLSECAVPDNQINAIALLDQADCLLNLNEYDTIISLCDQAIRLQCGANLSARAVVLKGESMYNKNEFNKAAQYFKRASILYGKIDKYGIPAFEGLIKSYDKLGLTEQASEARKKFMELYPEAQK